MTRTKVGVIGAGYVGLATAAGLASFDADVICIDTDKTKVSMLQDGRLPFHEPDLEMMVQSCQDMGTLTFGGYEMIDAMVMRSRVIFLAVDTPPLHDGRANTNNLFSASVEIGEALHRNGEQRTESLVVANKSTAPPGTCKAIWHCIDQRNDSQARVRVASNPEFLREGHALDDFLYPDRIVIGADHVETYEALAALYEMWSAPIVPMDPTSAEMVKYASNAFLAAKISFINEIGGICEVAGADVRQVSRGMGYDERIGSGFLEAGIGWSGSCFPKDLAALREFARDRGRYTRMLDATVEVNTAQVQRVLKILDTYYGGPDAKYENIRIAILGLAFKPGISDTRGSTSSNLAIHLSTMGYKVVIYDPIAGADGGVVRDPYAAVAGAHVAIVATASEEVQRLDLLRVAQLMEAPKMLIDGRNCFEIWEAVDSGLNYFPFGR